MDEHPNAVKARDAFETYNRREFERFMDIMSEDIVAHMPDPSQQGAQVPIRGRAELLGVFTRMDELSGGTQHLDTETVLADDAHVMAFFRGTAQREDNTHDFRFVMAAKVGSDGRWREVWYLADDERGHEEFWAE